MEVKQLNKPQLGISRKRGYMKKFQKSFCHKITNTKIIVYIYTLIQRPAQLTKTLL